LKKKQKLIPLAVAAAALVGACGSSSSTSSGATTTAKSSPTSASSSPTSSSGSGGGGGAVIANPSAAVNLTESGSSLLYPYLQELVGPVKQAYSNVTLAPAAGGSGKGITDATNGISQIGGSDAYLTNAELGSGLANIPIAVSAQDVAYNLPGVTNLKLSGPVLSQIYQGKITTWNNPAIAKLNPGVTLPSMKVIPVHRSDSSGDTFIFTGYLSKSDSSGWGGNSGPGQGTTVTWPSVPSALTASGNPGMVSACKASPGCLAYVGISAQSTATKAGLALAQLKNQAGSFVSANPATIESAVSNGGSNVGSNLVADLIFAPGAMSYPIVNFEYTVVKPKQSDPNTALGIRDFLTFATSPTGGSTAALLSKEDFQALPTSVLPKVKTAIATVK